MFAVCVCVCVCVWWVFQGISIALDLGCQMFSSTDNDLSRAAGPFVIPSDGSCLFNPDSSSTCDAAPSDGTRRICPCTCPV